jgi:hypothetical protein
LGLAKCAEGVDLVLKIMDRNVFVAGEGRYAWVAGWSISSRVFFLISDFWSDGRDFGT